MTRKVVKQLRRYLIVSNLSLICSGWSQRRLWTWNIAYFLLTHSRCGTYMMYRVRSLKKNNIKEIIFNRNSSHLIQDITYKKSDLSWIRKTFGDTYPSFSIIYRISIMNTFLIQPSHMKNNFKAQKKIVQSISFQTMSIMWREQQKKIIFFYKKRK